MEIIGLLMLVAISLVIVSIFKSASKAKRTLVLSHESAVPTAYAGHPRKEPFAQAPVSKMTNWTDDSVPQMLAELFTKTEEEIWEEVEIASLHSMLLQEDPRPETAKS